MAAFSLSRCDRSSSISCWPATDRKVVCASWLVASYGLTTWRIAFSGSTTRKYTTALTLTDTLSREMTSCFGTLSTTVRSSSFFICWIAGKTSRTPGPLTPVNRPSVNITPRSYSLRMRIELAINSSNMTTMTGNEMFIFCSLLLLRLHPERQIHDFDYARLLAGPQRARRAGVPQFSAVAHDAAILTVADRFDTRADHGLDTGARR